MALTKKDLQHIQEIIQLIVQQQLDKSFSDPENPLRKELKNDILEFKDEILVEIQKLRDDVTVVTGYRQMIDELETDVRKLKKIHPKYQHPSL